MLEKRVLTPEALQQDSSRGTEYMVKQRQRHTDAGTLYSSRSPGSHCSHFTDLPIDPPKCNDIFLPNNDDNSQE
jgi:hypothetical protein